MDKQLDEIKQRLISSWRGVYHAEVSGTDEEQVSAKKWAEKVEAETEQALNKLLIEARLDEINIITKATIDKPATPENKNDPTWQGGYRFAKNSLKRYKLNRIKQLTVQKGE